MSSFPNTIWDGSSPTRPAVIKTETCLSVYRAPDAADWVAVQSEVIAIEDVLQTLYIMAGANNSSPLSLSSTSGFFSLPTCAGTPTGVPANVPTGYVACIYDSTGNNYYVYNSGWKKVALT